MFAARGWDKKQATWGGGSLVVSKWTAPLIVLLESANLRVPFAYYSFW